MSNNEQELPQEVEQAIDEHIRFIESVTAGQKPKNLMDSYRDGMKRGLKEGARIALSAKAVVTDGDLVERMETAIGNIRHELRESHAPYAQDHEAAKACAALCPPQHTVSKYQLYEAVPVENELPKQSTAASPLEFVITERGNKRIATILDGHIYHSGNTPNDGDDGDKATHWLRPVTTPTPDNGERAIAFAEWVGDIGYFKINELQWVHGSARYNTYTTAELYALYLETLKQKQ